MAERFAEGDIEVKFDYIPTANNDIERVPIYVSFTVRVSYEAEEDTSNCRSDLDWEIVEFSDFHAVNEDNDDLPYTLTDEWEDHLKKLCHFRKEVYDRIEDKIWDDFNEGF